MIVSVIVVVTVEGIVAVTVTAVVAHIGTGTDPGLDSVPDYDYDSNYHFGFG